MRSDFFPFPADPRWQRLLGVILFLVLLYAFRHLAPVFICFVILSRSLSWLVEWVTRRTGLQGRWAILITLSVIAMALGLGVFWAVHRVLPMMHSLRSEGHEFVDSISQHPALMRMRHAVGGDSHDITDTFKHHAAEAIKYATGTIHLAVYLIIGLLLSVVYLFENEELKHWYHSLPTESIGGTLGRWFNYVADAVIVTVRVQVVVAIVNAILTLPVLVFMHFPHITVLILLILVAGLLPIVGNFISGAVLCFVGYQTRGMGAVIAFLVVTLVLHKIESYYLNPRLAAQHVNLPALVLVMSLLLFEQAFGFVGLFLSFPALYVAKRIFNEWMVQRALQA